MRLDLALRVALTAWLLGLPATCFAWHEGRHRSEFAGDHARWDRHGSGFDRTGGRDRSDPSHGWGTFECRSSECFSKHPQGHWSHPLTAPRVGW